MSFKVSKSINEIPSFNSVILNSQHKKEYGNCAEVTYKSKSIVYSIIYIDNFPVNTIGLNLTQRKYLNIENIEHNNINVNILKYDFAKILDIIKLNISIKYDYNLKRQIKFKELIELFENINNTIITKNNFIWMKWRGYNIKFEINNIEVYGNTLENIGLFLICDNLNEIIQFDILENIEVIEIPKIKNNKILKNINFNDLGIGGMNNELNELFRRSFNSRLLPSNVIKKYNIKHVKGILLHGPPGTGKTLIARSIGKVLNSSVEPVVINSSDIFNKYVGESENNIKKIFQPAYDDYKKNAENADLHVIIFDEFDAIAKVRGSGGDSTGVKDGIINLILTYIDGINQINNLLVIGITNRKDIIDPALIRPGRLEVHIYIGLPDEKGRNDIFNIHLNTFIKNNSLDTNVNIKLLAYKTNNYSGAEIEGVVKNAQSYAFSNYVDITNITNNNDIKDIILQNEHFDKALKEIKPNFGSENNINISDLLEIDDGKYYLLSMQLDKLFDDFKKNNNMYMSILVTTPNNNNNLYSKIIHKYCLNSNINHYKTLIPENITGKNEFEISKNIIKLINDANETHESIIYLDNLQDLLGHIPFDNSYYRDVLRTLKVYINRPGIKNKLIIIASCKNSLVNFLELVDLYKERFTFIIEN